MLGKYLIRNVNNVMRKIDNVHSHVGLFGSFSAPFFLELFFISAPFLQYLV